MEGVEDLSSSESESNVADMFKDFMARVTIFDELASVGSKLLSGYQEALELLRRPAIDRKPMLIESVIQANETERLKLYFEAGCIKNHDAVLNVNKLHLCQMGLHDHLNKATSILDDIKSLLEDVNTVIQTKYETMESSEIICDDFNEQETTHDEVEMRSSHDEADISTYATLMAVIYCNIKKDYMMQEKIVNALKLSSTSGELESYCLMWSLHPFIDDEIRQSAWSLIP